MRSTVFFILGLVVLASATKEVDVFAEVDAHPFGSSLLDLVEMNYNTFAQTDMKTEDTINQITSLLAQIQGEMLNNKKVADGEHKNYVRRVNNAIATNARVLAEQRQRRMTTRQQIANDQKQLAATRADLASAQKHADSLRAQIKAADRENTRAKTAFKKAVAELKMAIKACKKAVTILHKLGVVSLAEGQQINMVELKSGMEQVQSTIKAHLPSQLTLLTPIMSALVEMGTNTDPVLVKKVIALINQLRVACEAELKDTIRTEKVRIADYTKLRADLTADLFQTEARIGRDLTVIKSLQSNIRQNKGIVSSLNKSIPAVEKVLLMKKAQKASEQAEYNKEDGSRVSELRVIKRLIKFFRTRFANHATGLSHHLRSRVRK